MTAPRQGPLLILSGPSGSGKSTIVRRLLAEQPVPLHLSVSATTRQRRAGEVDGKHYYFWTPERFDQAVQAGAFLEWADVFGQRYGTLWSEVEPYRQQGGGVILEIDVQGAARVREICPDAVSFFLRAPSPAIYEERLRQRGTESEAAIQRRVAEARREEAESSHYTYQVVNDDLERALAEVRTHLRGLFVER